MSPPYALESSVAHGICHVTQLTTNCLTFEIMRLESFQDKLKQD